MEVMVFLIDMARARARAHLWGLGNMDGSSVIFKEFAVDSRFGGRQVHPMLFHLLEEIHQDAPSFELSQLLPLGLWHGIDIPDCLQEIIMLQVELCRYISSEEAQYQGNRSCMARRLS
jgi:hypothetical protein